jgi:succinoglycan biosynthesis transport protein ExoP
MEETEFKALDVRAYVKALWRRKWLIVVPVLAGGLTGFIVARSLPPVYESRSTVVVRVQERLSEPLARLVGRSPMEEQLSRLQEKVKSSTFLVELVRTLDMAEDEGIQAWARGVQERDTTLSVEDIAERKAVQLLQNRIAIGRIGSNAFQVIVRDTDRDRALLLAQHITNAFVSASNREQIEEIRSIHDFSVEQLVVYRQKLDEAEKRLKEFQENRVWSGAVESPITPASVNHVDVLISQAMVEEGNAAETLAEKRNVLRQAAPAVFDVLAGTTSEALDSLGEQLVELEREVASVLVRTTSDDVPEVTSLYVSAADKKAQYRVEARRLVTNAFEESSRDVHDAFVEFKTAEIEERMVSERRRRLSNLMWQYTQGRASAPEEELELSRLVQEVESNRALYEAFLEQSAAGQITEALEAARAGGRFEIVEPPRRPLSPVAPNKITILAMSVMAGLLVGLVAVLVVEQSDTSFKDVADIESTLGVAALATVPDAEIFNRIAEAEKRDRRSGIIRADGRSMLLRYMERETPVSFEFRRLARKLAKRGGGEIPKTIMVTSSHRGEGKTTAAACLAITLARHFDRKIVLVDADLRKPRIHQLLAVQRRPGLSDAIERGNLLGTDIKPTALANLVVLPCGTRREEPTWLLESLSGSRILQELKGRFDHVVIDSAPNVAVPDSVLLGSDVDSVIMVVRAGTTPREVVQRGLALQLEEKANVAGFIVNNLERVLPYYYDYRYYYSDRQGQSEPADERENA